MKGLGTIRLMHAKAMRLDHYKSIPRTRFICYTAWRSKAAPELHHTLYSGQGGQVTTTNRTVGLGRANTKEHIDMDVA